jgi:hypothetical protein
VDAGDGGAGHGCHRAGRERELARRERRSRRGRSIEKPVLEAPMGSRGPATRAVPVSCVTAPTSCPSDLGDGTARVLPMPFWERTAAGHPERLQTCSAQRGSGGMGLPSGRRPTSAGAYR